MPIQAANFYRQAKHWYDTCAASDETTIRSIISRAYYAAFLFARDNAGYKPTKKDVHALTIEFYKAQTQVLFAVGKRLDGLKASRVLADYYLDAKIMKTRAEAALWESRKILTDLGVSDKDLEPPPDGTPIPTT